MSKRVYNQTIRDTVLAVLRGSETALSVNDIRQAMGEGWAHLSYRQVANALYLLEKHRIIPQRDTYDDYSVYWQAASPTNRLEVLWDLPTVSPEEEGW